MVITYSIDRHAAGKYWVFRCLNTQSYLQYVNTDKIPFLYAVYPLSAYSPPLLMTDSIPYLEGRRKTEIFSFSLFNMALINMHRRNPYGEAV